MKIFLLLLLFSFFSHTTLAQVITCTGLTNDANASENVKFELVIKRDNSSITSNFGPFYKSSIKYFYSTHTSFTGIDIADHVSTRLNKISFLGSIGKSRNLTFNFNPDAAIQSVFMNYDSRIINQPVDCEISGALPPRPVCSTKPDKTAPLIEAIKAANLDLIETAIECGANVNLADKNGCTPVMIAIESACGQNNPPYSSPFSKTIELLDSLSGNGAFMDTADTSGETPLIKSSKLNIPDVYDTFIAAEVNFDAQDRLGNTALMYATFNGSPWVVEQILEGNPDRKIKNKDGLTAYDIAKKWQKNSVIDLVRIADTSLLVEGKDDGTCTPLKIDLKMGQVVDLTLKATDKMFKLDSPGLGLDLMADRNSSAKKTFAVPSKGTFKFTCGIHGSNKPSVGTIVIQ